MISSIFKLFKNDNYLSIQKETLPSQGYFYPKDLQIKIKKGTIQDQINYQYGIANSNIFGIIDTVKSILKKRITFDPINFNFNSLRAIDVFFLFIEFVKYTTEKPVYFNNIEFKPENFVYFNFDQFKNIYDIETGEFVFDGWRFSLPAIGIETSLNHFSYELAVRGKSEQYQNSNYNLIYFMGSKTELGYYDIINLVETMEDLSEEDQEYINSIVEKFSKSGLYFLIEEGKSPTRINPHMLKDIWGID
jgi:hypothetical protein